jgi:hypothetical protein
MTFRSYMGEGEAELERLLARVNSAVSGEVLAGRRPARYETEPEGESRGHSRAVVEINNAAANIHMGGNEAHVAVDQRQRNSANANVGVIRPDVGYTIPGTQQHVNIEVDTVGGRSHRRQPQRQQALSANDPRATNVFVDVDRSSGQVSRIQVFHPGSTAPVVLQAGPGQALTHADAVRAAQAPPPNAPPAQRAATAAPAARPAAPAGRGGAARPTGRRRP